MRWPRRRYKPDWYRVPILCHRDAEDWLRPYLVASFKTEDEAKMFVKWVRECHNILCPLFKA